MPLNQDDRVARSVGMCCTERLVSGSVQKLQLYLLVLVESPIDEFHRLRSGFISDLVNAMKLDRCCVIRRSCARFTPTLSAIFFHGS